MVRTSVPEVMMATKPSKKPSKTDKKLAAATALVDELTAELAVVRARVKDLEVEAETWKKRAEKQRSRVQKVRAKAEKAIAEATAKRKKAKAAQIRAQKRSDLLFRDGYKAAHALVMQKQDYAAGIGALRALGRDQHPDVANLLGFASRKLQRYDDAKSWYEAALAADPNHVRTWSYYGMWHAEQGNRLKAQDFLETVRSLCGNVTCREYVELKGVIDGTQVY